MRDFSAIDAIITEWVDQYELTLLSSYQDTQLRSVNIYDSTKTKWLLWIEPENKQWCINWWNYRDEKRSLRSSVDDLAANLESVHNLLKGSK